jgi:acetyl esterase
MISKHDREILKGLPEWNPTGDIAAQRRAWEELATVYNQDLPAIGRFEKRIELRAGLTADVAVPKGAGPHPVMVYLHGGGWAFGSPASFRKLGMQFAEAGYLTIVLDYRLAPEHPFPAAFDWCLADSLMLAQALSAAGSPYELHVMEGMPHGFMQMSELEGCRAAMGLVWEFLARNV